MESFNELKLASAGLAHSSRVYVAAYISEDFLSYIALAILALVGYISAKWMRMPPSKDLKVEGFSPPAGTVRFMNTEGKSGMRGDSCTAPDVVHKIKKARGRYASAKREFTAFLGLTRYFLDCFCLRMHRLCLSRRARFSFSFLRTVRHGHDDLQGIPDQQELDVFHEHVGCKPLRCQTQTLDTVTSKKGKRTKKPQPVQPTLQVSRQQAQQHVPSPPVQRKEDEPAVCAESPTTSLASSHNQTHLVESGIRQNAVTESCSVVGRGMESLASCGPLHRHCDNEVLVETPPEELQDIVFACKGDGDFLQGEVESEFQEVVSILGAVEDPEGKQLVVASKFHGREDCLTKQVEELGSEPKPVMGDMPPPSRTPELYLEEYSTTCESVSTSYGDSCENEMHIDRCMEEQLPATAFSLCDGDNSALSLQAGATDFSLCDGDNGALSLHVGSWHYEEELIRDNCPEMGQYFPEQLSAHHIHADTCSGIRPYFPNMLEEQPMVSGDWMSQHFQHGVGSLLEHSFEEWHPDVSYEHFMNEIVADPCMGDLASNMILENDVDGFYYWRVDCSEVHPNQEYCAQPFSCDADVVPDGMVESVDQPSFHAASWVATDEEERPPPDIVLGQKENEYINLQLIAEMGDWCVLKELLGEHSGCPFYWNRSTGQRTWQMPQIMQETGLGDVLMSYAQRAPAPDHDAPFHQRQVRAIRLSHGYKEKPETLRHRRRHCREEPVPTSRGPEKNRKDDQPEPELVFSFSEEAFPTLKKSFETPPALADKQGVQ